MPGAPITGGPQPPLQTSGPISMSDINNQFQRTFDTTIQLRLAETSYYASINTNSPLRPSGALPASLSEWYGYHHAATQATHTVQASASLYDYTANGVIVTASIAEAAVASFTIAVRVYWIDSSTSAVTSSVFSGTIGTSGTSVQITCNAPNFNSNFQSVAAISASPNPNGSQQYIF